MTARDTPYNEVAPVHDTFNTHGQIVKTRTILWCVPRSGSTALTKCLSFVPGMEVWFEPFCFCLLAKIKSRNVLGLEVPDHEYCDANMEVFQRAADILHECNTGTFSPEKLSYSSIKHSMEATTSPRVFAKVIAFALNKDQYRLLPSGYKHTFLIRHPVRVFKSNRQGMITYLRKRNLLKVSLENFDLAKDDPLMTPGLLFKDIFDLWRYVRENLDPHPIVIDGDDLLSNPSEVLPKYCRAIGLPYEESLLRWDESAAVIETWKMPLGPEDNLIEQCSSFYEVAMTSGHFSPGSPFPNREELSDDVIQYSSQMMQYYMEMYDTRLK